MSRRSSSRRTPKKAALSLSTGVKTGLSSLIDGNESTIASMLSVSISQDDNTSSSTKTKLMEALTDCMAMNNLSAEVLLARFFHVDLLRKYCEERLGVSCKGNEATLAARIARAWSKSNFEPRPLKDDSSVVSKVKKREAGEGSISKNKDEEESSTKKRQKPADGDGYDVVPGSKRGNQYGAIHASKAARKSQYDAIPIKTESLPAAMTSKTCHDTKKAAGKPNFNNTPVYSSSIWGTTKKAEELDAKSGEKNEAKERRLLTGYGCFSRFSRGGKARRKPLASAAARKVRYEAKEEEEEEEEEEDDDDDDVPRCFSCYVKVLSEKKACHWEDTSTCIRCQVVRKCPDCNWTDECINYKDEHGFCWDCSRENKTCEYCYGCIFCTGDEIPNCCRTRAEDRYWSDDSW